MAFLFGQVNPEFTIRDADAYGQLVYDLIFQIWGVREAGGTPNLQWPPEGEQNEPIALAGIAIGPSSDVDRAWLSFNRQKWAVPASIFTQDARFLIRRISLDAPITYPLGTGGITKSSTGDVVLPIASSDSPQAALRSGFLYIYPMVQGVSAPPITYNTQLPMETTVLPIAFNNAFDGTPTVFGFDANTAGHAQVFYPPRLHLLLFLKPPVIPPTKRFPLFITNVTANNDFPIAVTGATPTMIGQIPIFGRSRIRIMVVSTSGPTKGATFTAGVLRNINEDGTSVFETHHATQNADSGVPQFMTISDPCGDYLTLWAQPQVASETVTVQYTVTAYDGPGTLQGC